MLDDQADPLALEQQVCFALALASRSVIGFYRPILEPLGLTHPQYLVMLTLWAESPLRFGELANRLSLDLGTLSPLVRRLESAGLVTRRRGANDARVVELEPTDRGWELREQAVEVPTRVIERLGMPIERLETIRRDLQDLIAAVAAADRPTGPDATR